MATERRVLSSLDLLPEECQDDVVWALARLNERQRSQTDILFELNDRLAVKGHGPISRSAFSRRNVRLKRRRDRLEERSAMYAGIADQLTPDRIGDEDIVLGELIKTAIDEALDEAGTAKELQELAAAYHRTITAQAASAERRAKEGERGRRKMEKAIETAAGAVEKAGQPVDLAAMLAIIRKAYNGEA